MSGNEKGFTLLEALVAISLLSVASLGMMKLSQNSLKSTRTVENKVEYNAVLNEIREVLGNYDSCFATFGNRRALATPAGEVLDIKQVPNSGGVISKYPAGNDLYGNGKFKIVSYRLIAPASDPSVGIPAGFNEGSTNLVVSIDVGEDKAYSSRFINRNIRLNVVTTGADNRITRCTSQGAMSDFDARYVDVAGDTMTGNLVLGLGAGSANIVMSNNSEILFNSDKGLKNKIRTLKKTIRNLNKIRPVSYHWKTNNEFAYGFIAQDLKEVYPDLVSKGDNGFLSINYIQMTPLLVRGIQELDDESRNLKNKIRELEIKQNQIETSLLEMQTELCKLKHSC